MASLAAGGTPRCSDNRGWRAPVVGVAGSGAVRRVPAGPPARSGGAASRCKIPRPPFARRPVLFRPTRLPAHRTSPSAGDLDSTTHP